jgi:type II secretory pathway pseudopilin PulG
MTTRERLDRRRSPLRLVLVLVASTLVLLGIAAAVAVALLPPVLAETPRERITATSETTASTASTAETLRSATGSATVAVPAGWLVLGVGPFLAEGTTTVVSPDDAYRAEFTVLPVTSASAGRSAYTELLAAHDITTAEATSAWNTETLSSGYSVRWTELTAEDATGGASATEREKGIAGEAAEDDRGPTIVLATLTAPDPTIPVELMLVAMVSAPDAAAYRTVTADLLTEATLSATASTTPPTSPATGGGSS